MLAKQESGPKNSAVIVSGFRSLLLQAIRLAQCLAIGLCLILLPALTASGQTPGRAVGAQSSRSASSVPLELSLKQAVDLALAPDGNTRVQLAEELVRQSQARAAESRAALLPNLEGSLMQENRTVNLAAFGIQIKLPIPGFVSPELVGPFNTFDARASATQSIFDFSSIRRFQASRTSLRSTRTENESTRDQVAAQVAKAYLAALRTHARLEASQANVELAESILKLALNQKEVGTGTGIDVTRARVQLANERQQLLIDENGHHEAQLQLLRAIGLKLDGGMKLTDTLDTPPTEPITAEEAVRLALDTRADYLAQQQREDSAHLSYSAAKWERLPSVAAFADYGSIGSSINNAIPTHTYGVSLTLPVFDGGGRDARRAESISQFHQEQIRTRDLREQIQLKVRVTLDRLHSSRQQVEIAAEGLELAQAELAQAQRRYTAGVANSLEVTDAQTRLERARDNQILARFSFSVARLELGEAMGTVRRMIQ
jgi:outer membrane protein